MSKKTNNSYNCQTWLDNSIDKPRCFAMINMLIKPIEHNKYIAKDKFVFYEFHRELGMVKTSNSIDE